MSNFFLAIILLFGLWTGWISCNKSNYQSQIEVVDKVLNLMAKNDIKKIKKLMVNKDLKIITKDESELEHDVAQGGRIVRQKDLPSHNDYIFKEYPSKSYYLLDITVPFTKNLCDNNSYIIIYFVRIQPNMVNNFTVREEYDTIGEIKTVDTTLHIKTDTVRKLIRPNY